MNPPAELNAYTTRENNTYVYPVGHYASYRCSPGTDWDGLSPTRRWCTQRRRHGTMSKLLWFSPWRLQWTKGAGIKCLKPCGVPPEVPNAVHDGKNITSYMGMAKYRCKPGCKPRAEREVVRLCKGNGRWNGPDIICDGMLWKWEGVKTRALHNP